MDVDGFFQDEAFKSWANPEIMGCTMVGAPRREVGERTGNWGLFVGHFWCVRSQVAAVVRPDAIFVANAGDSRAALWLGKLGPRTFATVLEDCEGTLQTRKGNRHVAASVHPIWESFFAVADQPHYA